MQRAHDSAHQPGADAYHLLPLAPTCVDLIPPGNASYIPYHQKHTFYLVNIIMLRKQKHTNPYKVHYYGIEQPFVQLFCVPRCTD